MRLQTTLTFILALVTFFHSATGKENEQYQTPRPLPSADEIERAISALSPERKELYRRFLREEWRGFGEDGTADRPPADLIHDGFVDFPMGRGEFIRKRLRLYKYRQPWEASFMIPMKALDYHKSPEWALLSHRSDLRAINDDFWTNLQHISQNHSFRLEYIYKMRFTSADTYEFVVLYGVGLDPESDFTAIDIVKKELNDWSLAIRFGKRLNLEYMVISLNLGVYDLQKDNDVAGRREQVEEVVRRLVDNNLESREVISARIEKAFAESERDDGGGESKGDERPAFTIEFGESNIPIPEGEIVIPPPPPLPKD